MRRIKMLPDKGDPSIVLVVKIEVRDRMNARLDGPVGDSPCPRGLDNQGRLRTGDQKITASEAALGERVLGETSGLLRVIESKQGDDQQTSRADLILPAELAIAAVRDRHHEPGLVHAEPGPHLREGSIGAVVCPSHEAANRPAPTAYGRRGGTTKGLLPVGSDHHGSVAIHPETEKNKTHSAVRAPFDDPTGADRGRRGPVPPIFTEEDFAIDFDQEFKRLVEQTRDFTAQQAMDQVYRRVVLYLCLSCYNRWIENPMGS